MLTDKRDLPLETLQQFVKLKQTCVDIGIGYSGIITVQHSDFYIRLHDLTAGGRFSYTIENPQMDSSKRSVVFVEYTPRHASDNGKYNAIIEIGSVELSIYRWLDLIIAYYNVSLDPTDRFLETYQEEFREEFSCLDEDADVSPFGDVQQKLLTWWLEAIEEVVVETDAPEDRKSAIVTDIKELKQRIPSLTKNQTIKLLSRIFAKIKLTGQNTLIVVKQEGPKVLVKLAIERGVKFTQDHLPQALHWITSHL
ncbi:hypothetical protein [Puia dinghuensis]|uniref:Uncharacterized protein n=1 Tax=Puia dinghuensis TaxID=1792502 RepID=A0A8J2XN24_9BACT|nr:hypothetical protein [Puia dinghuensis]GGA82188.1 hypothetical protein GCM10011511_01440 [Puia dinghuensis]